MLTRIATTRRADDDSVDSSVAERDYVLTHIVAQLHRAKPTDGGQLVFKGGTALRLVHIGDYRYSADLDFTIIGADVDEATSSMAEVFDAARDHTGFPLLELFGERDRLPTSGRWRPANHACSNSMFPTPNWWLRSNSAHYLTEYGLISPKRSLCRLLH